MVERITPPKLQGHEDEEVFDFVAYRELIMAQKAERQFRQELLERFDEIAPILSRMESATEAGALILELDTLIDSIVIVANESAKERLSPDTMATIGAYLDTARRFASAAHALERDGAKQQQYANLTRECKRASVEALRTLMTALAASRTPQE